MPINLFDLKTKSMLRNLLIAFLMISGTVSAQHFIPSDQGSKVHFIIKNFGISTGGDLSGLKGDINFDPGNLKTSTINVSVDVKTVDTDNGTRDEHLRGADYFDESKYPRIVFKSSKINLTNKSGSNWFYFSGTLTMHGITKSISFPFTALKQGNDYLFKGEFELNRVDYGVGGNSAVLAKR